MKLSLLLAMVILIAVQGDETSGEKEPEKDQGKEEAEKDKEEEFVSLSCDDVHKKNSSLPSGAYLIANKLRTTSSLVYCHFENVPGCGDGPWTLLMKLDGNKKTFAYDSYKWRSRSTYRPEMAKTGLDNNETQSIAFSTAPFTKLCLGMRVNKSVIHWISLDRVSSSLYDVFNNVAYQKTTLGRNTWRSLLPGSLLHPHCTKEGFNVYHYATKARIGITANQQTSCTRSPTSRIGFGTGGSYCKQDRYNAVGNEACDDQHVKAFGYIMSKNEAIHNKIAVFTADEMMWIYLDGEMKAFYNGTAEVGKQFTVPKSTRVIAIHARNTKKNGGGIIGSTSHGEKTSSDWKCSKTAEEGWMSHLFDDSHWPVAKEYGDNYYPRSPLPRKVPGIYRYAKWIWTEDRQAIPDVYCRAVIEDELGCPHGWMYNRGSCYLKSKDRCQTYDNAVTNCKQLNSNLASIHSQAENDFFEYSPGSSRMWIGLDDKKKEGVFNWTDGTALDYTNWAPGEPNANGNEDCVELTTKMAQWNDIACYKCMIYMCKKTLHLCQVRNGDCSHLCVNTSETYRCACPYPGQHLGDDHRTCEVTGLDIQITNDSLRLIIPESTESLMTSFDIHFRDPECKAEKNGSNYILETPLDACGTTVVKTYAVTIYSNSIQMKSSNSKRSIGDATKEVNIPFFCFVSENGTSCVIPYQSHIIPMSYTEQKYGIYTVGMKLYDSKSFSKAYAPDDYPVAVTLNGGRVFFQVQTTSHNSKLTTMLNNCYISPSQDFEDSRKYFFIEDGCFTDNTVTYHKSTVDTKQFSVRVNQFNLESPYVYIHCKVMVCFARDTISRCAKGCMKDTKTSTVGDEGTEKTLSAGPIIFTTRMKKLKKPKRKISKKVISPKARKGSGSRILGVSYANFVILSLLCLIALVAGVWLLKKYRKKRQAKPGTYFNLSDNFGEASL